MNRKYITTGDGSTTIYLTDLDETYHSRHGAINEANHVFISSGLLYYMTQFPEISSCAILEIGLGTGLNAFLTALESTKRNIHINYTGVEAYPILKEQLAHINFYNLVQDGKYKDLFYKLHEAEWEKEVEILDAFTLTKAQKKFTDIKAESKYNLIYFDAFGPRVQPDLWVASMFSRVFMALKPGGILVTYCAQGNARRAMQSVGFLVDRIPGPPGKREMLRATKPN